MSFINKNLPISLKVMKIQDVLDFITFSHWDYKVYLDDNSRPYLQIICNGFCNISGKPLHWNSRKWFLSFHMTKSEIVQTALKATLTAMEHEIREQFLYRGRSIFDPHYDIDKLWELRGTACLDERN